MRDLMRVPPRLTRSAGFARALALLLALVLSAAGEALAQNSDARVARVRRLVNAGDRAAARQIADSMLAVYPEGSPEYADGLYARAISSTSAADAERDYLRIGLEYALSPRAEDAMMMLAQLRLARGDRAGARRGFERLVRDHPTGAQTAKASFWAGRLALEDGDGMRACPALMRARELAPAEDVELRNQIEYFGQRCLVPGALATRDTTPMVAETPPVVTPPTPAPPVRGARATQARAAAVRDSMARDSAARDSLSREASLADSVTVTAEQPAPPAAPAKEWSVQVATFPKERDAKALAEVLGQRGFTARVFGGKAPFRVRVGRYATREEADAALERMKASRLKGVIVEAEPR